MYCLHALTAMLYRNGGCTVYIAITVTATSCHSRFSIADVQKRRQCKELWKAGRADQPCKAFDENRMEHSESKNEEEWEERMIKSAVLIQ